MGRKGKAIAEKYKKLNNENISQFSTLKTTQSIKNRPKAPIFYKSKTFVLTDAHG